MDVKEIDQEDLMPILPGPALSTSSEVDKILPALRKARMEIEAPRKESENPYFHSKYADLASVTKALDPPLLKAGIQVVYGVTAPSYHEIANFDDQGQLQSTVARVGVETRLWHDSGQWIATTLTADAKNTGPQSLGLIVSYLRRYGVQCLVGVAAEDDDGNLSQPEYAAARQDPRRSKPKNVVPEELKSELSRLEAAVMMAAGGDPKRAQEINFEITENPPKFKGWRDLSSMNRSTWQPWRKPWVTRSRKMPQDRPSKPSEKTPKTSTSEVEQLRAVLRTIQQNTASPGPDPAWKLLIVHSMVSAVLDDPDYYDRLVEQAKRDAAAERRVAQEHVPWCDR
jgi:hypothetical protein